MKSIFFLLFLFVSSVSAQDSLTQQIKTPDFDFQPAYSDGQNLVNTQLEKLTYLTIEGVYRFEKYILLQGSSSPIRIKPTQNLVNFIVKQGGASMDNIQTLYKAFKLETNQRKNTRRVLFFTYKRGMLGNETSLPETGLPITFSRLKDNIYKLKFKCLTPGEYAIVVNNVVYSFGVDTSIN